MHWPPTGCWRRHEEDAIRQLGKNISLGQRSCVCRRHCRTTKQVSCSAGLCLNTFTAALLLVGGGVIVSKREVVPPFSQISGGC